jgi:hypothetical protein
MPSALQTSRTYARYGSRLASSMMQGDPGPSPFMPGSVTPAAAIVKLAHSVLAYGSQKRAQTYNDQVIADAQEKSDLTLKALRQRTDPSYMTDYQRSEVEHRTADEARLSNPQATPRAKVHLGADLAKFYGLGGEGDYDPDAVSAAKGQLDEIRLTRAAADAKKRSTDRQSSAKKYTAAQSELEDYDKQRTAAADAAESSMRASLQTEIDALSNPHTTSHGKARSRRILGLPPNFDASKTAIPEAVFENRIKQVRLAAEAHHDSTTAAARLRAHQVKQREAGTLLDAGYDPVGSQIDEAIRAATGASADSTGR